MCHIKYIGGGKLHWKSSTLLPAISVCFCRCTNLGASRLTIASPTRCTWFIHHGRRITSRLPSGWTPENEHPNAPQWCATLDILKIAFLINCDRKLNVPTDKRTPFICLFLDPWWLCDQTGMKLLWGNKGFYILPPNKSTFDVCGCMWWGSSKSLCIRAEKLLFWPLLLCTRSKRGDMHDEMWAW